MPYSLSSTHLKTRATPYLCAGASPSAAQAAGKRGTGGQQGVEGSAAAPAAAAQPAASAQRSGISIVPLDAAVVQKLRERDDNMAFKCTGGRPLPHLFDSTDGQLACCSVSPSPEKVPAEVDVLACRWHVRLRR